VTISVKRVGSVKRVRPGFVAEIAGVDLSRDLLDAARAAIHGAYLAHNTKGPSGFIDGRTWLPAPEGRIASED
jgi:hypothetical protein